MTLNCVAKRRLVRLKTKPVVVTQSLSTLVMTSLATQMHFRYQIWFLEKAAPSLISVKCCRPFSQSVLIILSSQRSQLDRLALHDSKRSTYDHTRKCAETLVLLGQVIITDKIIAMRLKNTVHVSTASVNHINILVYCLTSSVFFSKF